MLPSLVSETLRPMLPMAVWSPLCFAWNWHLRVTCFPCPAICIECGGKYGVTGDLLIYWLISPTPGWSVFSFVVIFAFVLVFVFVLSVAGVTGRFADLWVDCYLEVGDLGSWEGSGGWGCLLQIAAYEEQEAGGGHKSFTLLPKSWFVDMSLCFYFYLVARKFWDCYQRLNLWTYRCIWGSPVSRRKWPCIERLPSYKPLHYFTLSPMVGVEPTVGPFIVVLIELLGIFGNWRMFRFSVQQVAYLLITALLSSPWLCRNLK